MTGFKRFVTSRSRYPGGVLIRNIPTGVSARHFTTTLIAILEFQVIHAVEVVKRTSNAFFFKFAVSLFERDSVVMPKNFA